MAAGAAHGAGGIIPGGFVRAQQQQQPPAPTSSSSGPATEGGAGDEQRRALLGDGHGGGGPPEPRDDPEVSVSAEARAAAAPEEGVRWQRVGGDAGSSGAAGGPIADLDVLAQRRQATIRRLMDDPSVGPEEKERLRKLYIQEVTFEAGPGGWMHPFHSGTKGTGTFVESTAGGSSEL